MNACWRTLTCQRAIVFRPVQYALSPRFNTVASFNVSRQASTSSNAQSTTDSSASTSTSTSTVLKPKPNKSPSALKRTASASLPIRANPTPTRGVIQPVVTLSTAERYQLSLLRNRLPKGSKMVEDALWIPLWDDVISTRGKSSSENTDGQKGEIWIFGNGSIVCWGLNEDVARGFAKRIVERTQGVQIQPLAEPELEELEFVTDPTEATRLQGDLIILGKTPPLSDPRSLPQPLPSSYLPSDSLYARYSFSQALARSTALAALESSLDSYLASVSLLPTTLSRTGKPGLRRKELIKKLGQLLKFRQGVNLNRENFGDTPDFYWGEPVLESYFNSVTEALEIRSRMNSVNAKITYAAEVQDTLRELLTASSSHRMELIIIALIAVEVVIAIVRDGPELWDMVAGDHKTKTLGEEKQDA